MKKIFLFIAISFCFLSLTQPAFAYRTIKQNDTFLDNTVAPTGISTENIQTQIGSIIAGSLKIVGTLFFGLMIYGGFLWMTAHGEEEPITKAKNTIFAAIIGLAIIISAFAITNIVTKLTKTGPTGAGMSADGTPSLSPSAQSAENMTEMCNNAFNQCSGGCPTGAIGDVCSRRCMERFTTCNAQRDAAVEAAQAAEQNQAAAQEKKKRCEPITLECSQNCRASSDVIPEIAACVVDCLQSNQCD